MLILKNLQCSFRMGSMLWGTKIKAVDNISLTLPKGEPWILSIVGESGSGKTTLGRIILGLQTPTAGEVRVDGRPIGSVGKDWPRAEFYREVQPIFQNPFSAFNMHRTVDRYLLDTAMKVAGKETRAEAEAVIVPTLAAVGLDYELQVKGKYPNQFSGGELQRIAIARALLPNPKLVVADEPVAMIDASLRMNVVNLFKRLKETYRTHFIYVTHDLSTAYYVSDYLAVMYRGQFIETGRAQDILAKPSHPYTMLLLESIPKVGEKWDADVALPDMEAKEYASASCKFAPRCRYAQDICRKNPPREVKVGEGHAASCFKLCDYKI